MCLLCDLSMRVSDVDIKTIQKLLSSVPQGMEITSIDLTNGYSLNLKASTDIIYQLEYEQSLSELRKLIVNEDKNSNYDKNFLLKNK